MSALQIRTGQVNIDAAGTAERFTTTYTKVKAVIIKADPDNTGVVYVGNDAASDVSSTTGLQLNPGDSVSFYAKGEDSIRLDSFYFDAATNDDDIHIVYFV